ncbi:MAG: GNAT family N-acetyltransferase, partial [Candidatus Margulisiibacteriota bacterium]
WSEQDFLSFTKSSNNALYEIRLNSNCVGFIQLTQVKPEADLVNIAVAKPLQNMGVGTQALHQLVETLKSRGVEKIFLEVKQTSPAVEFYSNSGFVPAGTRKEYYPDGSNALRMERVL